MKVRSLADAELELDEAVAFYDGRAAGLGIEFAHEVQNGLLRIKERPLAWQRIGPNTRRHQLNRFPYGLDYAQLAEEILSSP